MKTKLSKNGLVWFAAFAAATCIALVVMLREDPLPTIFVSTVLVSAKELHATAGEICGAKYTGTVSASRDQSLVGRALSFSRDINFSTGDSVRGAFVWIATPADYLRFLPQSFSAAASDVANRSKLTCDGLIPGYVFVGCRPEESADDCRTRVAHVASDTK